MSSERQRAKRHERLDPPPAIRITERDIQILDAVYQYRLLSQAQIRRLLFNGLNPNTANRRLHLLYHNAYLERRFLLNHGGVMTSEILYFLDHRGRNTLLQAGLYDDIKWDKRQQEASTRHLEHLYHSNTFRIEVVLAAQQHALSITTWLDDFMLHQDFDRVAIRNGRDPYPIIPDGYFQVLLPDGKTMHFFFEFDNHKMSLPAFKEKIQKYLAWERSGQLFERFQTRNFRVLIVTTKEKRMQDLRKVTYEAGGARQFWFTTLAHTTAEQVLGAPIWWLPIGSTPFTLMKLEPRSE